MTHRSPGFIVLWILVLGLVVHQVRAGFNPSPISWGPVFELDPGATDPVSQGDDHLRQIKNEVRRRLEVETDFSTVATTGAGAKTDTGRNRPGSAVAFFQSTAPPVDGTLTAACLKEPDTAGNRGCDGGRLWVDSSAVLSVSFDSDADGDADSWLPVTTIPTNSLILWDTSNTCPTGYTEATGFRNHAIVGADRVVADVGVPDDAGVSCDSISTPAGCGAGSAQRYNRTQETLEMAAHIHQYTTARTSTAGGGQAVDVWAEVGQPFDGATYGTTSQGGNTASYGPLRTVLVCRKT